MLKQLLKISTGKWKKSYKMKDKNLEFWQRHTNVIKGIYMVKSSKSKWKAMCIRTKKRELTNFEVALKGVYLLYIFSISCKNVYKACKCYLSTMPLAVVIIGGS